MATTGATSRGLDARGTTVGRAARRLSTETKQAFKTSEFWAMIALLLAILVSAALIEGRRQRDRRVHRPSSLAGCRHLGAGHLIPAGGQSGSREPYTDDQSDRGARDDRDGIR